MNIQLYLLRHGESELKGRFCGSTDCALTRVGHDQARARAEQLKHEHIELLFSSPLRRAMETANYASQECQLPIEPLDDLREIDFGQWEGLLWQEVVARDASYSQQWLDRYPDLCAPEGESFADFRRRVLRGLGAVLRTGEVRCAHRICVVAHAGWIRAALSVAFDQTVAKVAPPPYGSVQRCTITDLVRMKLQALLDAEIPGLA